MFENERLPMNLQLFAESEEGGNEPGAADPASGETGAEVIEEGGNEPGAAAPVIDENAIYARARRAAERRMDGINARVESRFGGLRNPETGDLIRTVEDYFDALDAQERLAMREEVANQGIDPEMLEHLISNNPVIQQAQQVLRENSLREGERELEAQIRQIAAINPDIHSLGDICEMQTFPVFDSYVRKGLSLMDAYRLANFDALSQRDAAANRQAAINAARGKGHLSPIGGSVGEPSSQVEIPERERELWEEAYPGLSYKELREKYNKSL